MDDEKLLEVIAKVLETKAGSVALSDDLRERNWDSLADIIFIAEIDDLLGVTLDADELAKAQTGEDLKRLVTAALA